MKRKVCLLLAVFIATAALSAWQWPAKAYGHRYLGHTTGTYGGAIIETKPSRSQAGFHRVWYTVYYDKAIPLDVNVVVTNAQYDLSFLCGSDTVLVSYTARSGGDNGPVIDAANAEHMSRFEDNSANYVYQLYCNK